VRWWKWRRGPGWGRHRVVAGVVIIVFVLVVVLPIVFILSGLLVAIVLGAALKQNGEATHAGSELIDLNR
jgi:hypothetical protein